MTKELKETFKVMGNFCRKSRNENDRPFYNRIFVHNDIMYATDGYIMCLTDNITDKKDFSYYDAKTLNCEGMDSDTRVNTNEGKVFEKIIESYADFPVEFDIDFDDIPLPVKLQGTFKDRYSEEVTIDLDSKEAKFDFEGGMDNDGVTATYGDIIKNVESAENVTVKMAVWHVLKVMQVCKVKKIHYLCNVERKYCKFVVGKYTFYITLR